MITLTVNTKPWEKLKKELRSLDQLKVKVGWFDTHYGPENDNLPHAYIAALQEEVIGPRPFMRVGLKAALKQDPKAFAAIIDSVASGKSALISARSVAPVFVPMLQKVMDDWMTPPNSRVTVLEKGFNNPLIDTGELRDSIQVKVEGR